MEIPHRLSERSKTDVDADAVAEKHRKAEERYKTNLTPTQVRRFGREFLPTSIQVVEHNRRVEVVGAAVQIGDMEKRRQLDQQLKEKQERANQKRQEVIETTKEKAAKVRTPSIRRRLDSCYL